jgi:hypothetical protein
MKFDDDERSYHDLVDKGLLAVLRQKERAVREWIFDRSYRAAMREFRCAASGPVSLSGFVVGEVVGSGDERDQQQQQQQQQLALVQTAQDTVSSGFELVISMKLAFEGVSPGAAVDRKSGTLLFGEGSSSASSTGDGGAGGRRESVTVAEFIALRSEAVLSKCGSLIDAVLGTSQQQEQEQEKGHEEQLLDRQILAPLSSSLTGRFLYYKFKRYELMAGSFQLGSALSSNIPASVQWLTAAAETWQEMLRYNYHGSEYVQADPNKEYAAVLSELGILHCTQRAFASGTRALKTSVATQRTTLSGYSSIRIATEDVIRDGWMVFVDSLVNAAICEMEQARSMEQSGVGASSISQSAPPTAGIDGSSSNSDFGSSSSTSNSSSGGDSSSGRNSGSSSERNSSGSSGSSSGGGSSSGRTSDGSSSAVASFENALGYLLEANHVMEDYNVSSEDPKRRLITSYISVVRASLSSSAISQGTQADGTVGGNSVPAQALAPVVVGTRDSVGSAAPVVNRVLKRKKLKKIHKGAAG